MEEMKQNPLEMANNDRSNNHNTNMHEHRNEEMQDETEDHE